ncbi:MAG: type II secretion system protein [Melioribacteraceae bacterium]|nr:type II secretion system protein [Melioribacteraceae bacterium]
MTKRLNEKGITLVELIAALALVSMVGVLIMTTMGIGFKYSIAESNKTSTQQEANIIVQKILNKHRLGKCYKVTIEEDIQTRNDVLFYNEVDCRIDNLIPNPEVIIKKEPMSSAQFNLALNIGQTYVDPKKNDFNFIAILKYGNKATYQINTVLTRYKTN